MSILLLTRSFQKTTSRYKTCKSEPNGNAALSTVSPVWNNKETIFPLFITVSHRRAHTVSARRHSGEWWLITLRAPHWDVRNNYLCLAAAQDPSGEVIILTRGCSLQSQLIHINSGARATRAIWMHGSNYTHYRTRQGPRNSDFFLSLFFIPVAQQLHSNKALLASCSTEGNGNGFSNPNP